MYDYETEMNVLSGMLKHKDCLYEGIARFRDDHFYDPFSQVVFATIARLAPKGQPSFAQIVIELKGSFPNDKFKELNHVFVNVDSFPLWADRLHDFYVRRKYLEAAQEIEEVAKGNGRLEQVTEIVEKKILSVHQEESNTDIIEPEEAGESAFQEFKKRLETDESIYGIKLSVRSKNGVVDGFPSLDKTLMGLKGGDLVLVCAASGEGKTAFAQNVVRLASIQQKYFTYYENTEMDPKEMVFRFVSQISKVDFQKIYTGKFDNPSEKEYVEKSFEAFKKSNVYISQLPTLTPQKSRGLARKFKLKYGQLDLLVIDYIGRMEVLEKGLREDQVLSMVAKESKRLAQELNCAVILLAQLTDDGKIEGARRIKNDADAVYFIERLAEEERKDAPRMATHKMVKFKVRRGSTEGYIYLNFNKAKMYITEV
jgi:replicative DNA helicase